MTEHPSPPVNMRVIPPAPWLIQGDARRVPLADGVVQCVVTSPPYWALRDYGHDGSEWDPTTYRTIGGEVAVPAMRCPLGLEPTPEAFVGHMLTIFREVWRVLRDDGTCWVNIGDSYASSGGNGEQGKSGQRADRRHTQTSLLNGRPPTLKAKDLVGIPWMLAFALRADGWYLRQDVIWHKPNPMPESTRDRCTKAHEYVFLLTKRQRYYFDAEGFREPAKYGRRSNFRGGGHYLNQGFAPDNAGKTAASTTTSGADPAAGRNKRSVWTISTESCREAHFATYPTKLVTPCILAGTSERGCCPECRAPWKRVVDRLRVPTRPGTGTKIKVPNGWDTGKGGHGSFHRDGRALVPEYRDAIEVGNRDPQRHVSRVVGETWLPGCKCDTGEPVPCIVYDPFNGAGTTAIVAMRHGRQYVGTELSSDYLAISQKRIANDKPPRVKKPRRHRAQSPAQLSLAFNGPSLAPTAVEVA